MPWPIGTDATDNLKTVFETWLRGRLTASPYKQRLPRRHIVVGVPNSSKKISGSIKVLLYTGKDDEPPYEFNSESGYTMEETHRITIDVQSDERGAKANEDALVASIIRQIMQSPTERAGLIALGVYNVKESADELEIDGVDFKRPINFTCSTDTLISN